MLTEIEKKILGQVLFSVSRQAALAGEEQLTRGEPPWCPVQAGASGTFHSQSRLKCRLMLTGVKYIGQ